MDWNTINFKDVHLSYCTPGGVTEILHGLNISIVPGEISGILGESGAGKSLFMRSLCSLAMKELDTLALHFLPRNFVLRGELSTENVAAPASTSTSTSAPAMAMIFQDAKACLNPSLRTGQHLREILRYHEPAPGFDSPERLLELVDLPVSREFQRRYPHELSGGMQQRLAISCAIAANVNILLADEALTALDSESARQILNVFSTIVKEMKKSILLVSHDLRMIERIADRVIVMYSGYIVEERSSSKFFQNPLHPYSHALLESHPAHHSKKEELREIPGDIAPAGSRFLACPFVSRCAQKQDDCLTMLPPISTIGEVDKVDEGDEGKLRCFHPITRNSNA